ncbi:MAG TPA: cobalamin biosynthesis protein CobD [Nitrospirae bacterium]|nr:cobalamin biosynthesis protein [bacterium BMS3Bbin05]HDO21523.1 cobalamin biosynthesis protein CobD [Nitrospirota bacterium]HDO36071.1 cobalamin biosynthesis protein CobD [Nitrospirota bacterium]HDZ88175.1 cobalamin biosynthesis protein CobD [Nitrospirota bacterium]
MISGYGYSIFHISPFVLGAAFLLDLAIGDPRWFPHPVVIIGFAIGRTEAFLRRFMKTAFLEKIGGIILIALIIVPVFISTYFVTGWLYGLIAGNTYQFIQVRMAAMVVLVCLAASTIAVKGLVDSGNSVIQAVEEGDVEKARRKLSMVVGRDTHNLTEKGILKAATETLAENLSDGIVAPLFYLVTGGLPLAMTYKAVNTLDSMVGYSNERYRCFGWAAAKLDDLANYIPARITGLLVIVAVFVCLRVRKAKGIIMSVRRAWDIMMRDGRKHSSPNSGIPEAAMAGALGVRLGGPSSYGGIIVEKPHIGDDSGTDYVSASKGAVSIVRISSFLGGGISICLLILVQGIW